MARTANKGSFKKGHDPRRHELTREERQRGFQSFLMACRAGQVPSRVAASVRMRIRAVGKGPHPTPYVPAEALRA